MRLNFLLLLLLPSLANPKEDLPLKLQLQSTQAVESDFKVLRVCKDEIIKDPPIRGSLMLDTGNNIICRGGFVISSKTENRHKYVYKLTDNSILEFPLNKAEKNSRKIMCLGSTNLASTILIIL